MNLCFVCSEYPPSPHGGIGTFTRVLGRALARRGHGVRVIGVYPHACPEPEHVEDGGVEIWRLREPGRRLGWVAARYALYCAVRRWSRGGEIDLVEVPDWQGLAAGWPRLPVPVVARLHGSATYFAAELGRRIPWVTYRLERWSMQRADVWCSVSEYAADKSRRLYGPAAKPHAVLYNLVDLPPNGMNGARSRNRVVFAGTLAAKKGIVSLIRAWPQVLAARPDAELHVYGKDTVTTDGHSMRDRLASELTEWTMRSVRFHGHVAREDVLGALRTARVAVFPSYAETFGLAPLEAMACGCPTIYSRRGPGPEVAPNGRAALLVEPDAPAEIADSLIRVLSDDRLAEDLGRAGREHVAGTFSADMLVPQNEEFYLKCINEFGRSGEV